MRLSKRLVAPVLAGVLGLTAGTAVALAVDIEEPGGDQPSADPLGLGVEMTNLECTGQSLLVIGSGGGAGALAGGVADNRESEVRYLRVADSCDTVYAPEREPTPDYAAYLGPFAIAEACDSRMTVAHRGDLVTVLTDGNVQVVRCACYLDADTFLELTPGISPDAETTLWVRALQQMLVDIDEEKFPQSRVTGVYDEATEDRVRELQGRFGASGVVDAVTWRTIRDKVCDTYDYE